VFPETVKPLSTFNEPDVLMSPSVSTSKLPCPTFKVVPSNVKLVSSSNNPSVPTTTILLFVNWSLYIEPVTFNEELTITSFTPTIVTEPDISSIFT
jgi:hypothetical protein